ncbi:MAG: hypothetical protein ACLTS1_20100 [Coprococcus sp.]
MASRGSDGGGEEKVRELAGDFLTRRSLGRLDRSRTCDGSRVRSRQGSAGDTRRLPQTAEEYRKLADSDPCSVRKETMLKQVGHPADEKARQ